MGSGLPFLLVLFIYFLESHPTQAITRNSRVVVSHLQATPSLSPSLTVRFVREKKCMPWCHGVRGGGLDGRRVATSTRAKEGGKAVPPNPPSAGNEKARAGPKENTEADTRRYWSHVIPTWKGGGADQGGSPREGNREEKCSNGHKRDGSQNTQPSLRQEDDFFEDMKEYFRSMTPSPPPQDHDGGRHPPFSSPTGNNTNPASTPQAPLSGTKTQPGPLSQGTGLTDLLLLDRVLAGVTAAALALPGLLRVRVAVVGKFLWRIASYKFPVALGAYAGAALLARWTVGKVQGMWRRRPVRDMHLDSADRDYERYGVILQREAHEYFKYLPASVSSSPSPSSGAKSSQTGMLQLLTAALELPCLLTRRDEYVQSLSKAVTELSHAQSPPSFPSSVPPSPAASPLIAALRTDSLSSNTSLPPSLPPSLRQPLASLPVVDQGQIILSVRLGDATARLARDALLGSARKVQAAHR